ncbi:manganese efflux pump MntP family protein [Bifidobacterium sp. ESL0784]|uniref:manganese efflux pump MntP n=1 Tax=Bifidobacterium sp. ESL0784 TaxID=2983231 RepID=UPI0023F8040D|nr:manganese efflux pump MntP family protein [Bifidobacterium sp. ESL0784]MDF7640276.1 manganese efflux pump MntP family protein [Bifidobacterium sp. ESL0784]
MIVEILLIAVSVSMDAFAIAIGKGLATKHVRPVNAIKTALWFGGFQALFPILGYFFASLFGKYVEAVDHWIIFGLLALIGGNMIREAFGEPEEDAKETAQFDWRHMAPLAVACSIDAFAVGVSFQFMPLNIWGAAAIIGVITGAFSIAGLYLGHSIGVRWQQTAQIIGGIVLILIGLKTLLEHLGIITW